MMTVSPAAFIATDQPDKSSAVSPSISTPIWLQSVWASADGPATANTADNIAHNTHKAAKRPHTPTEPDTNTLRRNQSNGAPCAERPTLVDTSTTSNTSKK